ncbi:MAG: leucyl/phenylalanyl-tRNA--protein transferase [Alphaproteobacteria bacterium]|nr:leucyl/phenylalanyl-tRNA--protein transferase [Alphaproteobacteria bacterium]
MDFSEGYNVTPDFLLRAYSSGIFPMAESKDAPELMWLEPDKRCVMPLDGFHIPKRLRKTIRQQPFHVTADTAFYDVIEACSVVDVSKQGRDDTWINDEIIRLYTQLHERGNAHSVECWKDGELVGGLYGVSIGSAFFGESMFSAQTDASKIALCYLVSTLIFSGFMLLDAQFMTEHLKKFGAIEVQKPIYKEHLNIALSHQAFFNAEFVSALKPEVVASANRDMLK